jgi:Putative 2OG-Fe(II) oxygenase
MHITTLPPVHLLQIADADALNAALLRRFLSLYEGPETRRSHFFHGRFENLYIDREQTPEIWPLLATAEQAAQEVLGRRGALRCGHWFNLMGPGQCTSLHTHEEHDELLSAVYYVTAPERSGDLILEATPFTIRLRPTPGILALFPPDLAHAVETNESDQVRLSVAFNFGPA